MHKIEMFPLEVILLIVTCFLNSEPTRDVTIHELRPNTQYFIRLRANDNLGPGRIANPISLHTRRPGGSNEILTT